MTSPDQLAYGRSAFGYDPARYAQARPDYPAVLYEWLEEMCGVAGKHMFEVGPGTGMATARLLEHGPASLTAVEPDARRCEHLVRTLGEQPQLRILTSTFEEAVLARGAFDLGVAAMSFHWLDQESALAKAYAVLRPRGWWAMWWNVYGDAGQSPDEFTRASANVFETLPKLTNWDVGRGSTFTMDAEARLADLRRAGFVETDFRLASWPISMTADQVVALTSTWSFTQTMSAEDRDRLFDGLRELVETEFGGRVQRTFFTPLYVGRKT